MDHSDDERAQAMRQTVKHMMVSVWRLTDETAERYLSDVENGVRRECLRVCEATRAEMGRLPDHYARVRVDPVVTRFDAPIPLTVPINRTVYHGAAAGADACVEALRERIKP